MAAKKKRKYFYDYSLLFAVIFTVICYLTA